MEKVDIVPLQGMGNCRKFAGLKLFRSGRPDEATHDDIKTLFYHDIPIIIDFRANTELLVQETDLLVNSYYKVYQLVKGQFKERDADSQKATADSQKGAARAEDSQKTTTDSQKGAADLKEKGPGSEKPPAEKTASSETASDAKESSENRPINSTEKPNDSPETQTNSDAAAKPKSDNNSEKPGTSEDTLAQAAKHPEHRHYFIPLAHCMSYHMALFKRAPVSVQFRIAYYFLYDKQQGTNRSHGFGAKMLVNPHGLLRLYKDLIQYSGSSIVIALKLLCEPSNAGALICCSLGKDRTGILSALVLHICGRSREEICADYARSKELIDANEKMAARAKQEFINNHLTDPSFPSAEYSTMNDLLEFIDTKYGSIDQYLDSIEFDESYRDLLRSNLIEDSNEP